MIPQSVSGRIRLKSLLKDAKSPRVVKSLLWDFCLMSAKFTVIYWRYISPIGEAQVHQIKLIATLTLTGHWMHHAGSGAGKAAHVPEWGVHADAGLLAERTPAENGHQRHPQQPADTGQESSGLPGHPGLKLCSGFRILISVNLSGENWIECLRGYQSALPGPFISYRPSPPPEKTVYCGPTCLSAVRVDVTVSFSKVL